MPFSMWPGALLAISILTGFGMEGLKKMRSPKKLRFKNIDTVILSLVLSTGAWGYYILINNEGVSEVGILEFLFFSFMNFIVTTVGYDKIMQSWDQIKKGL